eukprot:CAMPEP_0184714764 /NCGR_PEP_ID=MMETSP0314-20130426/4824_1 /TAXON_ID=38298 /ORGANISM="Rhodella maculata, Strain CCMP 736" /LENGTH=327 /DNA_ID=CAMNT_0027177745 /DNA_START=1 /DNA_END=981 /DNA_ORIENTATION=+
MDDSCMGGSPDFLAFEAEKSTIFKNAGRLSPPFRFGGLKIAQDANTKEIHVTQPDHIQRIEIAKPDNIADIKQFRSKVGALLFIVRSQPLSAFNIGRLTHTVESTLGPDAWRELNNVITKLHQNPNRGLFFPRFDLKTLRIFFFPDSSFANKEDLSIQLGNVLFLCDADGNIAAAQLFISERTNANASSAAYSPAKALAFVDAFDFAFALGHELSLMLGFPVPVDGFTDSKGLFDLLTNVTVPTEKRLRIDVAATRQSYDRNELWNIGLLTSKSNPGDPFSKASENAVLSKAVLEGKLRLDIRQWIFHPNRENPDADRIPAGAPQPA